MAQAKIRVLYSFPHQLGTPGINTTAWQQVNALSQAGASVVVYCTSLARPLPPEVQVVETMRLAGRRIPHRAIGVANALRYHDWRVARALARRRSEFDVIHCWPSGCLRTIRTARKLGIATFRELPNAHTAATYEASSRACEETRVELPKGYSHRYSRSRLNLEEREFAEASFLLAPSQFVADSFTDRGVIPDRVLAHQYGYDPDSFNAVGRDDTGGRPFTALFVGRGEPPKGLHTALQAWRETGITGRFLIAGSLLPAYREYLIEDLSRADVEYRGFVSDVASLMRESDVLVFPTYTEGSALVTYEAMACGVVPLVSTAAGAPIADGVNGLIHQLGDRATLERQLTEVATSPDRLAELRKGAIAASHQLTWRSAGERLLVAYQSGLANAGMFSNTP